MSTRPPTLPGDPAPAPPAPGADRRAAARSGAASNVASTLWLVAVALLAARALNLAILSKIGLDGKPLWWFVAVAVIATGVWAGVEWATLRPWIGRGWRAAREMGVASVLGVLATVLPPLGSIVLYYYIKPFATWLRAHPEGVWIYMGAFVVLGGVALLPTYAQSALGGFAFGLWLGTPLALVGFAGAAMLGYFIALRADPAKVQRVIDKDPRAAAVRRALIGGGVLRQIGLVSLVRLPPNSPFALTNLVLTAAGLRWWPFLAGTVLGMTPRTVVAVYIGASVKELTDSDGFDKARPDWVLWAGMILSVAVLIAVMLVAKRALAGVLKSPDQSAGTGGGGGGA